MLIIQPVLAANALVHAIQNATTEGKITVCCLLLLPLFSWTIIITKFRQLMIARGATKKFFEAYNSTRDPLEVQRTGKEFGGAPAYQLYIRNADELAYHLKNSPVQVMEASKFVSTGEENTAHFARCISTKVSGAPFEAVRVVREEAAGAEAMSLERDMTIGE